MKFITPFWSCAVVVGLSVASPGRALADPIILQPVAVGSVNALNGQIFTQDFQTFISSNNSNQFSAILEFDLSAFEGRRAGSSRLAGSLSANNALDTGSRQIGLSAYSGNLMLDVEDLIRPAIPIGSVTYHPLPTGEDPSVSFDFDITPAVNTLLLGGANAVGIRFDALNFQAPSTVNLPGQIFAPTRLEISPVPEPATLTLLGIGLAATGWTVRRRDHGRGPKEDAVC
jgi:hypothetical protein